MRALSLILIVGGMLWMIFELFSPGLLPSVGSPLSWSLAAMGGGLVLLWLDERGRQQRRWKGLGKTTKYYD
jgi:membrane associated rhomboid family serine protease